MDHQRHTSQKDGIEYLFQKAESKFSECVCRAILETTHFCIVCSRDVTNNFSSKNYCAISHTLQ